MGVESKRMEGGEKRSEKYTREKETRNSSAILQDNLKRMGRARSCTGATTNEGGGEFKMAGASLLDLKANPNRCTLV